MARMVTLRSDSDIVTKQESFKPNEMKRARGRETPGFSVVSCRFDKLSDRCFPLCDRTDPVGR